MCFAFCMSLSILFFSFFLTDFLNLLYHSTVLFSFFISNIVLYILGARLILSVPQSRDLFNLPQNLSSLSGLETEFPEEESGRITQWVWLLLTRTSSQFPHSFHPHPEVHDETSVRAGWGFCSVIPVCSQHFLLLALQFSFLLSAKLFSHLSSCSFL